jgi:hypothetical protein
MKTNHIYPVLLLSILQLFSGSIVAQNFYIVGGINSSSAVINVDGNTNSDDFENIKILNYGIIVEVPVNGNLSFETGIVSNDKGFKITDDQSYLYRSDLTYLDFPLDLKYWVPIGDNLNGYVLAGAYLGLGISGRYQVQLATDDIAGRGEGDIKWGDTTNDHYNRPDSGLRGGMGIEFRRIALDMTYNYGMKDIMPSDFDSYSMNHRFLKFSARYKI